MERISSRFLFKICSLLLLISTMSGVCFAKGQQTHPLRIVSNPQPVVAYQMTSSDDTSFTNKNFMNHWTLLYFGYTNSPTVCPRNMNMLSDSYKTLSSKYPNLQMVLVTIDPKRDTSERLKQFMAMYNNTCIGITGSSKEINKLTRQLGIHITHQKSAEIFKTNNSNTVFLIDPKGRFFATLTSNNANELARNFEKAVKTWNSKYSQ